jgi:hypothetical protein
LLKGGRGSFDAFSEAGKELSDVCDDSVGSRTPSRKWCTVHNGTVESASFSAGVADGVVDGEDKVTDDACKDGPVEDVKRDPPKESGSFSGSLTTGESSSSMMDFLIASVIESTAYSVFRHPL